jgi:predicted transposase/invertase (TIGR01784 family)
MMLGRNPQKSGYITGNDSTSDFSTTLLLVLLFTREYTVFVWILNKTVAWKITERRTKVILFNHCWVSMDSSSYICALIIKTKRMTNEKMTERLDPLNDFLFLKFMGEKGDEEQLLAFLNAVLKRTGKDHLQSVEIVSYTSFTGDIIGDKSSILDIRALTNDGTHVNVEVQVRPPGSMSRRSLFYWSKDFSRSLKSGKDYDELPNVIAINILGYEFLPEIDDFHMCFHLREDTHSECILTEALEMHFIDMVKFHRLRNRDIVQDPLHRWLTFLNKHTNPKVLKEIITMDTAIQKADAKIRRVLSDKEAFRAYEMREMAKSDYTSTINFARQEGIREGELKGELKGRQEGIREGKQEGIREGELKGELKGKRETSVTIAKEMKANNIPFDTIQKYTHLSMEEIERL